MKREKTAVEWLVSRLKNLDAIDNKDVQQAKQMEKEQIKQDVYNVCKLILSNPIEKSGKTPTELFEIYYESKYGKYE